ncbi:MAG: hypothetical protein GAK45_01769 [Pseudomonas citronellolis]|nr:MAG: hypothetical protein GAK45_01769 [Pseudomonas citronellolis]
MRVAPVIPLVEESDFPELEPEPAPPSPLAPAAQAESLAGVAPSAPSAPPASPAVAPAPSVAAAPRGPSGSIDSLDGANIYIAYGRFGQAREMLIKSVQQEPQRRELRLKLMMVLAELGDTNGFLEQEAILRGMGGDPLQIEQLRAKYSTMREAAPLDEPTLSPPAAETVPLEPLDDWEGLELDDQLVELEAPPQPQPQSVQSTPAPAPAEPLADNLNLDDLSLDLDWTSLDDPFQVPSAKSAKTAAASAPVHEDFHSNLHEFPEITEFDLDGEHGGAFDMGADSDHAHDELLAGLDQARASIDHGDLEQAYRILKGIIAHGDSREQEQARELLAQIA